MSTTPSIFSWPVMLDTFASLAPALAAWRAGRLTWREPVGQVAVAWAVMTGVSVAAIALYLAHALPAMRVLQVAGIVLLGVLLVPAFCRWIGPSARRWQPVLLATILLVSAGALLGLGSDRRFSLVYRPVVYTLLTGLTLAVLAAQARRAAQGRADAERGWLWIGGGHLVYFVTAAVSVPLMEAVLPGSWRAALDVHFARLIVMSATMFVIAYGIWVGRRVAVAAPARADGRSLADPV